MSNPKLEGNLHDRFDALLFAGLDLHCAVRDETPHFRSRAEDERGQDRHHNPPLIESAARPSARDDAPPEDRAVNAAPDAAAPVTFRADNNARRVNKSHKSTQGETGFARFDKEGRADKIHSRPAHVGENPQVWSHEKRP